MSEQFTVKDSGQRAQFDSGMIRDTETGKTDYTKIFDGPMADRWAEHLTKGAVKYPDDYDGSPNWMKAAGTPELLRYRRSAMRHFRQWLRGDRDEDHAAAVFFNINGYEYVRAKLADAAAKDAVHSEPERIAWPNEPGLWQYRCLEDREFTSELYRAYSDVRDHEGSMVLEKICPYTHARKYWIGRVEPKSTNLYSEVFGTKPAEWRKVNEKLAEAA